MSLGSAGDPITAATKFNEAVEATAVIGSITTDVATIKVDVSDLKGDMKHVRSRIDDWTGRALILGAVLSLGASIAISVLAQPFARALAAQLLR